MSRTLIVDDPVIVGLLPKLSRSTVLGHSGRPFLEHLLCTWRMLVDWRLPGPVCRAGFMHSAYSTSFYPHALFRLDQRELVRSMIGPRAEALVFRFCTMDRRSCWDELVGAGLEGRLTYPDRLRPGVRVPVSRKTFTNLLMIESANVAEQSRSDDGGPAPWMSRVLGWWQILDDDAIPGRMTVRPSLAPAVDERAIEAYRLALAAPAGLASALLDDAMEHNPWAGEPRILRALCALENRDKDAAVHAQAGAKLLSSWAVAWDKRLSLKAWQALADRIVSAAEEPIPELSLRSVGTILTRRASTPEWLAI